ncbi:EF-hand domain-containing family member B [Andrena cerasifolii]|uniref:EF-hand domain-containing family member B n=1 Tax=Andrena cerasifolii TaxID=2819439 RepID=UPI0040384C7D
MYCINTPNEVVDKTGKKFRNDSSSLNTTKECLREYSLEDQIDALKIILTHNEKYTQDFSSHRDIIRNIKEKIGMKECLQAQQETPFQTLISELRNTVMNSYWNKEVGKTRYQVPNLPVGMNPLETSFGIKTTSEETMADVLRTKAIESHISDEDVLEMYKKSHNNYQPAEQISRNYKEPFNQNNYFGMLRGGNAGGTRVKRLLTWINTNPITIVNSILADFIERSHSPIGKPKNLKSKYLYMDMTHGKPNGRKEMSEIESIFSDCVVNNDVILQQKYLQYINSLRQMLKKRISYVSFIDVSEELSYLDKEYAGFLPEDKVFSTLAKYQIYIKQELLKPLLDHLQMRKEGTVDYMALLKLLNWKYHFPTLPKVQKTPLECQHYSTSYNTTIGNMEKVDDSNIPIAGITYDSLSDTTTAYSLIFPNIFTRHGLSSEDLSMLRSKEEIRSIFESSGVEFPDNTFDTIWENGLKKPGTEYLSVETFKNLLDQQDLMMNEKKNG